MHPSTSHTSSTESVLVIPPHGIQLETHRGLPSLPLAASRRFIPTAVLQDFVINEGLRGWDVRYYLVAIKRSSRDDYTLEVAYEVSHFQPDILSKHIPKNIRTFYPNFQSL